jgi:hypothetical protein
MFDVKKTVVVFVWQEFGSKHIYVWRGQLIVASMLDTLIACAHMHNVYVVYWLQLQRAPIKFGQFIKIYNINVKVLYKQANRGYAEEAFFWGGRGRLVWKGCNASRATDFQEKRNPPQADSIVSTYIF